MTASVRPTADGRVGAARLVHFDPERDGRWDDFIAHKPAALFSSRAWLATLSDTFGLAFTATAAEVDSTLVAAVLHTTLVDALGTRTICLPFCDLVEPTLDHPSGPMVVDSLLDRPHQVRIKSAANPVLCADVWLETNVAAVWQRLEIGGDPEDGIGDYAQLTRRMIKRSRAAGVTFRTAFDLGAMRTFYELHLGVRKHRYRLFAQPYRMFENIHQRFIDGGNGFVLLGQSADEALVGVVCLITPDALYYKFAASSEAGRNLGANHAAVHEVARHAFELGLPTVDLGRSDLAQPGLVDFKRRFGAVAHDLTSHETAPPTSTASVAALRRDLSAITELFTWDDVPDSVTELAGDQLYRYFA